MAPIKTDAVHRYFQYDETSNKSTCQLCNNKLKGKHTTNLKSHLSAKHPNEYKVIAELNKNNIQNNKTTTNESTTQAKNATIEKLKRHCVRLVTIHGRPLTMMEDEAFQDIINMAAASDISSKNINVKAIKTKITEEANEIRRKISAEIRNRMISLKLDSATCLERKFIGVNIQYVENAKVVVRNLSVLEVHQRQTASFLKNAIEEILVDFMISPDQIYCICTDNGSNMIKMVKIMGGTYESEDFYYNSPREEEGSDNNEDSEAESFEDENEGDNMFNTMDLDIEYFIENNRTYKVRGMLCAAHTLQLAVKDAINSDVTTQTTIALAKTVVSILRKPNIANSLRCANLRKPVKECATRWTSTFNMLVRLYELKDFCISIPEINGLISDRFWVDIEALIKCFQPANEATIVLQKQQLTLGDFYITWLNCKNNIAAIEHNFASSLHTSMTQREAKLLNNDVLLEALYLDGRLNVVLSAEQCQKARKLLIEVHNQLNHLKAQNITTHLEHSDTESIQMINSIDNPLPTTSASRNLSAVEDILRNSEISRGSIRQHTSIEICLYELCAAPRISINENILVHWCNKAFSEIAAVAMVVLGAPATQVSVERLFSSLKFILHPLRSNISSTFLKDLMLVRENKDLL